jgi:hypothetical protein
VVVFVFAVLVATTGISLDQPPDASGKTTHVGPDQRPALVRTLDGFRDWLSEWRRWAHAETDRRGHAATIPAPPLPSSTRRPL